MVSFKCDKCHKKFNNKTIFTNHMNRKTSCVTQIANTDNTCPKCDKNFSTYVSLWQHVNNNICEKKKGKGKMQIPKKIKELTWYKYIGKEIAVSLCMCCNETEICQMSFHCGHNISEANGGELKVENMRPICAGCNSSMGSMNMNDFIKKFKLNGKIIESQVTQKIPQKNIVDPIVVTRYKNENGKIEHKCNHCSKIFKHKNNFTRHMKRTNPCFLQKSNEANSCKSCNKKFNDSSALYKHIDSNVCHYEHNLNITNAQKTPHENSVNSTTVAKYKNENGKTQHQCNKCNKIFKQKCNYDRHLNRKVPCDEQIANEKNECKICLKTYSDTYSLHKHVKKCARGPNKTINRYIHNDYVVTYDGTKWNINKKEDVFKDIIYAKSDFICMKFTNFINQRKRITKTQLHEKLN